jgi:PAS domain S-box-containing protein/putative nucleotidyltransferase with HDIG domain
MRRLRATATRLHDAQARFRALVEHLPGIAVYRADFGATGAWHYISPQVEDILQYTPAEWTTTDGLWLDCLHPDDRATAMAGEEESLRTGLPLHSEYRMRARDGSTVWVRDEAVVLEEGGRRFMQGFMQDVTELKRAEETLRDHKDLLEREVAERTLALEHSRLEILQRLATAAEWRDDETYEHTERVGRTAGRIAERLGLKPDEVGLVRRAAPLHDVGKLGVSDTILLKPGPLDDEERAMMQRHAEIGADILARSHYDVLQCAEEIARTHHERWDGAGYPAGLSGADIPLAGRITAVADVFDALTHTRPYKEAWPLGRAVEEIRSLSGAHFDPEVVEAFLGLDHQELLARIDGEELVTA